MTQALFSQLEVKQTHHPRELQPLPAKRGWLCNYAQHHSPGTGPCIDFTHGFVPPFLSLLSRRVMAIVSYWLLEQSKVLVSTLSALKSK